MTLKISVVLITLALSNLPQLAAAQGNLVVNGGFDGPDGWTFAFPAYYNVKNGNPPPDVVLDGESATASQTINSLNPGITYVVSGDYQWNGGSSTDPSLGVALDGVYLFETAAPADANWHSFNFDYTATSTSALLSLAAINGAEVHYSIDNISMEAVPEPSSLCLIGVGGIMSALFFRSRRKIWRQCDHVLIC